MNAPLHNINASPSQVEAFLSRAFERIRRITIALAVASTAGATLIFGWRSGLGAALGSLVGYINLVWLHHGSALMIERMLASLGKAKAPSKLQLNLAFAGRYVFVIAISYVILKSFPSVLYGFIVALFFPILAAMCEGVYEACVNLKIKPRDETSLR